MAGEKESVILIESTGSVHFPINFLYQYHTHIYCHSGSMAFVFNNRPYVCKAGEFVFWFADSKLSDLTYSRNFKSTVLLVEKDFLLDNIPDQSRGIDATLHSKEYPVLHLNDNNDKHRILSNFQLLYDKSQQKSHLFYHEVLKFQMRLFVLDMWHTFANEIEHRKRSVQSGTLYERFIHLVQEHCKKEREVRFYAQQLHITPKYLNYICKITSGITASEWIQRYVRERLELVLQNTQLNIAEIADDMGFSSRSFFTRYVKKVLGVTPSVYRNRLG